MEKCKQEKDHKYTLELGEGHLGPERRKTSCPEQQFNTIFVAFDSSIQEGSFNNPKSVATGPSLVSLDNNLKTDALQLFFSTISTRSQGNIGKIFWVG